MLSVKGLRMEQQEIIAWLKAWLAEDIGTGDITSALTIPDAQSGSYRFVAREAMVVCGLPFLKMLFALLDDGLAFEPLQEEGAQVEAGATLARISGKVRPILAGERVALNLLQHLCGVATLTAACVAEVSGTGVRILDTRKTTPGLRAFDKYAVRIGGGTNHRMRLDDAVLIKDNHIAAAGSITTALRKVAEGAPQGIEVTVECDTLAQLDEALFAGAKRILLDNMSISQLRDAVKRNTSFAFLEASGNMRPGNLRAVAETGVDAISIGALTHSIRCVDIGLDSEEA